MRPALRRVVRAALVAVAAAGAACSQHVLYSKVDEREANEQVAVLRMADIDANKVARENAFDVTVPDRELARATMLLKEHGLPRRQFQSRCTVFKKEGFVTSSAQEHELTLCAKAQEISRSINLFAEVLDASVVLDAPDKGPLMDKAPPPKASVVVRFRSGVDVDEVKSRIRRTLLGSVHGLTNDNVAIEHSVAEAMPTKTATVTTATGLPFDVPWPLALAFGLGLVSLLAALLTAASRRRNRAPNAMIASAKPSPQV